MSIDQWTMADKLMEQKEAEWNGRKEKKTEADKIGWYFLEKSAVHFTTLTPIHHFKGFFFFQIKKEKAKKMYIKKNKNIKNNKKFF